MARLASLLVLALTSTANAQVVRPTPKPKVPPKPKPVQARVNNLLSNYVAAMGLPELAPDAAIVKVSDDRDENRTPPPEPRKEERPAISHSSDGTIRHNSGNISHRSDGKIEIDHGGSIHRSDGEVGQRHGNIIHWSDGRVEIVN